MANTVTNISYANTFGEWVAATDVLIGENNVLGKGNYTKDSGTLTLSESSLVALSSLGDVVVNKQLRSEGSGSFATVQNNLTVGGQIFFSNTTSGLTANGQTNFNGLVLVQGPNYGISVSNNAYVGGNTSIRYNSISDKVIANTSVSTANVYATNLTANTNIYANTATAWLGGAVVGAGGLTVNGNFVLTGQTVYAANTFVLSSGVSTAISSYYNVDRGSTGIDASIRWNESSKQWEMLDVDGAAYYRILWSKETPFNSNNIVFNAPFGDIVSSSNTTELAIQSLETRKAALTGAAFSNVVTGITVSDPSVSNTAFATTAYVQSVNSYASGVTAGVYGGGVTPSSVQVPVLTINTQGKVTQAANVTVTSTSVYANSGQLTANASVGVVALGLPSTGVIAGSYGSSTTTPILTVDAFGRITGATTTLITGGSAGIGATTYNRQSYTATAGQTSFTVTSGYTVGYLQVYVNGVLLNAADYTASNGTTFVLGAGASVGDIVEAFSYTVTLVNNLSPSYAGGQGGAAGVVLYQSAANTTSNTAVGTSTYLLQSNGSGAPTWVNPGSLAVSTANTLSTTTSNSQFFSIGVNTAASASAGEIRATGTITAGYSDDELKTKLGNIDNALDKVMTLSGFYYEPSQIAQDLGYKIKKEVGVSAQEVQKVLPEVVVPAPIDGKYLTVQYDKLIPLLIEAIKELKNEVEVLKGQIK
jgi:hypothetical protein